LLRGGELNFKGRKKKKKNKPKQKTLSKRGTKRLHKASLINGRSTRDDFPYACHMVQGYAFAGYIARDKGTFK